MIEGLKAAWKRLHPEPMERLTAQIEKGDISGLIKSLVGISQHGDDISKYFDPLVQQFYDLAENGKYNPFAASFLQKGRKVEIENYQRRGYILPYGYTAAIDLIYPTMTHPDSKIVTLLRGATRLDPIHQTGVSFLFHRSQGLSPVFSFEPFKVESISSPALKKMDSLRASLYG